MQPIAELAAKAVETPDQCSNLEIMRLGLWFTEHKEHVLQHHELANPPAALRRLPSSPLVDRLAPPRGALVEAEAEAGDETHETGTDV